MWIRDNWGVSARMTYAGHFHHIAGDGLLVADVVHKDPATGILHEKPSVPIGFGGGDNPLHKNRDAQRRLLGRERQHIGGICQCVIYTRNRRQISTNEKKKDKRP